MEIMYLDEGAHGASDQAVVRSDMTHSTGMSTKAKGWEGGPRKRGVHGTRALKPLNKRCLRYGQDSGAATTRVSVFFTAVPKLE